MTQGGVMAYVHVYRLWQALFCRKKGEEGPQYYALFRDSDGFSKVVATLSTASDR